jgi:putative membrane protein
MILSAISLRLGQIQDDLWLAWNLDPTLLIGLLALLGGYLWRRSRLREDDRPSLAQVASFLAGWLTLVIALVSPLDTISDRYLFSAHMVQHMLIAVVAPCLLLVGLNEPMLAPALRPRAVARTLSVLANPFVAFFLLFVDLFVWHLPRLYDATLTNEALHVIEHLTFIALGVLFWWPVVSPTPSVVPRMRNLISVLYLFLACQPMVLLGALLTFAEKPYYLPYVTAPRISGLTALTDQQLGGLIMWLPTNIPYLLVLSILFFQWFNALDRAERAAAGEDTLMESQP